MALVDIVVSRCGCTGNSEKFAALFEINRSVRYNRHYPTSAFAVITHLARARSQYES